MGGEDPAGGSAALVKLIETAGEEILADFQCEYGLNLGEEVRRTPPRRLLILIQKLPLESRTLAKLRGGEEFVGWGTDRYLMAQLIDAVNAVWFATAAANAKKKPKVPKPTPRPSKKAPKQENEFRKRMNAKKAQVKGG